MTIEDELLNKQLEDLTSLMADQLLERLHELAPLNVNKANRHLMGNPAVYFTAMAKVSASMKFNTTSNEPEALFESYMRLCEYYFNIAVNRELNV